MCNLRCSPIVIDFSQRVNGFCWRRHVNCIKTSVSLKIIVYLARLYWWECVVVHQCVEGRSWKGFLVILQFIRKILINLCILSCSLLTTVVRAQSVLQVEFGPLPCDTALQAHKKKMVKRTTKGNSWDFSWIQTNHRMRYVSQTTATREQQQKKKMPQHKTERHEMKRRKKKWEKKAAGLITW